jgi:hypothetical protein
VHNKKTILKKRKFEPESHLSHGYFHELLQLSKQLLSMNICKLLGNADDDDEVDNTLMRMAWGIKVGRRWPQAICLAEGFTLKWP